MKLFVRDLTVIDSSYLCERRGMVGESWLVDIEMSGELNEMSMLLDFGRVKKLIKLCGINPHYSCPLINETFLEHIHCHVQGCGPGTFSGAALKHIKCTFLDGEFDVKHVMERLL